MLGFTDEIDVANAHARATPNFYAQVERNFTDSYLGMLVVRGLTTDLANIIQKNLVLIDPNNDTLSRVFHIGSIKLLVKDREHIAVHVHTNEGQRCGLLVYIWHSDADATLTAEFQMIGNGGRSTEFKVPLPGTLGHPICEMLAELKRIICQNTDANVDTKIKAWAAKQK